MAVASHTTASAVEVLPNDAHNAPSWRRRILAIGTILFPAIHIIWWSSVPARLASLPRLALPA